jgi:hypothetical protein
MRLDYIYIVGVVLTTVMFYYLVGEFGNKDYSDVSQTIEIYNR